MNITLPVHVQSFGFHSTPQHISYTSALSLPSSSFCSLFLAASCLFWRRLSFFRSLLNCLWLKYLKYHLTQIYRYVKLNFPRYFINVRLCWKATQKLDKFQSKKSSFTLRIPQSHQWYRYGYFLKSRIWTTSGLSFNTAFINV